MVTLHCDTRLGRNGSVLVDGAVYVVAAGARVAGIGTVVRQPSRVSVAHDAEHGTDYARLLLTQRSLGAR